MSHHKPDPNVKVNLTINGIPITVPEGTRILEAAQFANVKIPTLCEHPDLCKRGLCRICVVEADGRGKLIAACANDVWEGVNIVTNNLRLLNVRKTILELILANHPQDCLTCVRNTKCELQTLAAEMNIRKTPFEPILKRDSTSGRCVEIVENRKGENLTLVRDMDKCVKCCRCVEACQNVEKTGAINTSHRSKNFTITTPFNQSLKESNCNGCEKCADVCPVGAIYSQPQTV